MKSLAQKVLLLFTLFTLVPGLALAGGKDWPEKVVFGAVPTESSANATERWHDLVDYLGKTLGVKIEFKTATDYAGVITGMQFKHVDLAYLGPKSYVEAADRAGAEALVLEVGEDGSHGYHGMIVTKKDSGLKTMEDIKGKVWAFTDPNSTSGTLVPTVYFSEKLKIDPEKYFSKVIYSGSHEASILAVKSGKVHAAATNDLDMLRGNGVNWNAEQDFNVLWTSELIPGSPIAVRKDLPESLKQAIKAALIGYKDNAGLAKLKIKGYVDVTDKVYDPIREQIEVKRKLAKK